MKVWFQDSFIERFANLYTQRDDTKTRQEINYLVCRLQKSFEGKAIFNETPI